MPVYFTVDQYLATPETNRPREVVYGVLREPPAPYVAHQFVVTHLGALLDAHVRSHDLGWVAVSPIDVILDRERALVVQPDIVFVAAGRIDLVRNQVWGAPDLVVEVLSRGTARRDRTVKLRWYRQYGVHECWLVDPARRTLTVIDFAGGARPRRRTYRGGAAVRSAVLPRIRLIASEVLA